MKVKGERYAQGRISGSWKARGENGWKSEGYR
jgi:hypothetical protein